MDREKKREGERRRREGEVRTEDNGRVGENIMEKRENFKKSKNTLNSVSSVRGHLTAAKVLKGGGELQPRFCNF